MASLYFANKLEDWIYCVDDNNQRRIKCRQSEMPGFYVSLSHSGDWVAVGISGAAIGIDIETYARQRDFIAIASHVFSVSETAYLKSLAPEKLNQQFYLYWTLKECVAKKYGHGLKFEVSRAHAVIPETEPSAASIFSWETSDYVVSMAGKPGDILDMIGLGEPPATRCWKTVSV